MNDAKSTVVGLKAQDCPGGGWNGQPANIERATVADCLAHGVCGCIYGGAVQHIEQMQAALEGCESWIDLWTVHVGYCKGADACSCGRTAILHEARAALADQQTKDQP